MQTIQGSMLHVLAKMQDREQERLRKPRELETGISEKKVVHKCFIPRFQIFGTGNLILLGQRASLLTNLKYLKMGYIFYQLQLHTIHLYFFSMLQSRRIAKNKNVHTKHKENYRFLKTLLYTNAQPEEIIVKDN